MNLADEKLVDEILKTKSESLFEVLYDRYSKIIYNKCLRFSRSDDEAKDLAQEIFLKLFIKLGSYHKKYKFSAWLYLLTYNHCVNYVNRDVNLKMSKNSIEIDDYHLEFEDTTYIDSDDKTEARIFEMKIDKLEEALGLIQPEDKMILLLKYQDDVSIKKLSKLFDIGESAVKMRLKRARERLIKIYENEI
jgi:RNA polymerase sigma-70 factor (ECF subfamily)